LHDTSNTTMAIKIDSFLMFHCKLVNSQVTTIVG